MKVMIVTDPQRESPHEAQSRVAVQDRTEAFAEAGYEVVGLVAVPGRNDQTSYAVLVVKPDEGVGLA